MTDSDGFGMLAERFIKNMKEDLEELANSHPNKHELDDFIDLYKRFIKTRSIKISWEKIKPPEGRLVDYKELKPYRESKHELLNKLAVLKLNGGLGTTMGMVVPKSAIKIRDGKNLIDLNVEQLELSNRKYKPNAPLILMNSSNTDDRTKKPTKPYENIKSYKQSMFPKISTENLLPISGANMWFPTGHGDVFRSLERSGILVEHLNEGKEYLFVSVIDNLAATIDSNILQNLAEENLDFCMEVTNKTRTDIKGGTLITHEDALTLLEIAQVPSGKKGEFTSTRKFKIFTTYSVWINLKSLRSITQTKEFNLDIIQNKKDVNGEMVIELETAMDAAIRNFNNNCGIIFPRSRFLPIETCSDLFLLESDLFKVQNGFLIRKSRQNKQPRSDCKAARAKLQYNYRV